MTTTIFEKLKMRQQVAATLIILLTFTSFLVGVYTRNPETGDSAKGENEKNGVYSSSILDGVRTSIESKEAVESQIKDSSRIVVGLDDENFTGYLELEKIAAEYRGEVVNSVSIENKTEALVVEIPADAVSAFMEETRIKNLTRYLERGIKVRAQFVPNDPQWNVQWALQRINAEWAWNTTLGTHDVLVAVVDTGIDWRHPDLIANYAPLGYDWVNDDEDPSDDSGHGTHCAGILAAVSNNNVGIAGLAQVRVLAEKVLDSQEEGYSDWVANGIIHAVEQGARIISMSFGVYEKSEVMYEAIKYAHDSGVLLVAAAGNDNMNARFYPAAYDEVIGVAATDLNDLKASFSNFGEWVELSAPGVGVVSTFLNNNYKNMSGTSMACPYVSGLAALILSSFPNMPAEAVRLLMRYSADDLGDIGYDAYFGYGRINAQKALDFRQISHELIAFHLKTPPFLKLGTLNRIVVEVFNFGKANESNVLIQFFANGSVIWSSAVDFLQSYCLASLYLDWIPPVEGLYNITAFVVPIPGEEDVLNNVLTDYLYAGSPARAVVLRSSGNTKSEVVESWNVLNTQWESFGSKMVYVDYVSLNKEEITYEDIKSTEADVLIVSAADKSEMGWEFKSSEIQAIDQYTREGHGLIVTGDSFNENVPNNWKLADLLGLKANLNLRWNTASTDLLQIFNVTDPLFSGVPNPLVFPPAQTAVPLKGQWSTEELAGGHYISLGFFNESAIVETNGLLYISAWLEALPARYRHHLQLLYNAILWSRYEKPQHDLMVTLDCPQYLTPNQTALINATVHNMGWRDENNVQLYLSIEGDIVNASTIGELPASSSHSSSYSWIAPMEARYNISAYAIPLEGESRTTDNFKSQITFVHFPRFVLWDNSHVDYSSALKRKYLSIHKMLRDNGFIIDELENSEIDSETLIGYDILVLPAPDMDFSFYEVEAIVDWVTHGGSVFVTIDIGFTATLRLLTLQYGVQIYRYQTAQGVTSNIVTHIVTQGVSSIYYASAVGVEVQAPSQVLAWTFESQYRFNLVSVAENEKAAIISDDDIIDDKGIDRADNAQLIMNIFHWLATKHLPNHDIAVNLEVPASTKRSESVVLKADVQNRGLNNEVDIKAYMLVNDTVVESVTIPQLLSGDHYAFRYSWTPTVNGDYNITLCVSSVIEENYTANNVAAKKVQVFFYERYYFPNKWIDAGDPTGWHADDGCWSYTLPFIFPFYNSFYQTIYVSSNGLITFLNPDSGKSDSLKTLATKLALAPAWHDWTTSDTCDIYIGRSDSRHVIIRWEVSDALGISANFAVVLGDDGVIRFHYGYNDQPVSATVGISNGAGHIIGEYVGSLNYINTVIFAPFQLEHEIAVQLGAPNFLLLGDSVTLSATVFNLGLANETGVTLRLMVNGIVAESSVVSELSINSFHQMNWLWKATVEGNYNLTACALPVAGEVYTDNNVDMKTVFVGSDITTHISIYPETIAVTPGDVFTIDLKINNVIGLHAWQLMLYYNTTILNCLGAAVPSNNVFADRIFIAPEPLIEKNYTLIGATLVGGEPTFTGQGILSQIQFKAETVGNSSLLFDLENTFLLNSSLKFIECKLVDGYAEVKLRRVLVCVEPSNNVAVLYRTLKINVSIANVPEPGVYSYEFKLYYDNTLLYVTRAEIPPDHWLKPMDSSKISIVDSGTIHQTQGYVSFAATLLGDEPEKTGNGTLATVTFRVEDTGCSNITISDLVLVTSEGDYWTPEKYDVYSGLLEAGAPDFNHDGRVDTSDLEIMRQAFGSYPDNERWNRVCDINDDSKINILDMAITAKAFGRTPLE